MAATAEAMRVGGQNEAYRQRVQSRGEGIRSSVSHEGSRVTVDACCLSMLWNMGGLYGNAYCRLIAGVEPYASRRPSAQFYNRACVLIS